MYRVTCYLRGPCAACPEQSLPVTNTSQEQLLLHSFYPKKLMGGRNAAELGEKMRKASHVFISSSQSDNIHRGSLSSVAALYLDRRHARRSNKQKKSTSKDEDRQAGS